MVKLHTLIGSIVAWFRARAAVRNAREKDFNIKWQVRELFHASHEAGEEWFSPAVVELAEGLGVRKELNDITLRAYQLPRAQRVATLCVMHRELQDMLVHYRQHVEREIKSPRPI